MLSAGEKKKDGRVAIYIIYMVVHFTCAIQKDSIIYGGTFHIQNLLKRASKRYDTVITYLSISMVALKNDT